MSVENLVVVGASLAGLRAVEAARKVGFSGRVTLIGAEEHLPYNRPPLSKALLEENTEPSIPLLRAEDVVHSLELDLRLGTAATGLDTDEQCVALADGWIGYDALVIATGATPRALPGAQDLAGVHTLRTWEDALAVRRHLDSGARTVVVGGGFLGSEIASAARKRGLLVTIIESLSNPLVGAIGEHMGAVCSRLHEGSGTQLRRGVTVTSVTGSGRVEHVHLSDGTTLEADLVIVGIGAVPETGWLSSSTLELGDGIVCDETLHTGAPGVYAAGDVARWYHPLFGRSMRVEHWTGAAEQGTVAARNALDPANARSYDSVPYFWSDCFDSKIQFGGVAGGHEPRVVSGDVTSRKFTALYPHGDRLGGVLTMNNPAENAKYQALIAKQASWPDAVSEGDHNGAACEARGRD